MTGKLLRARYEVGQVLSEGPIFRAYQASDRVQGKEVCIRAFQPPFDHEEPFVRAVGLSVDKLMEVKHPGVERIAELDDDEGVSFLIGELSPGTSLSERIKRFAPFSVPVAVSMAVSIAEGLSVLHREGIVHGDLGAHTVSVTPEGSCRLQLAGIWTAYSSSSTAGVVVLPNMAPYLAPEISQGSMPTPASDVYALGVLLFQLLTGRPPFLAEQPVALVMKHASDQPPSLKALNASVPSALEQAVAKAMSKDATARYPNAESMLADLRMVQDAMRFGKSVTWPPKESAPAASPPVAPQLSGIQGDKAEVARSRRRTEEFEEEEVPGDVPGWLRMVLVFFIALVVFMVSGWLIFNLNKPRSVEVPNIRNLMLSEAEENLRKLNLKLRIARRQVSETDPAGRILDTDPSPGSRVIEGQSVSVVVSDGPMFVEVPDVRGITPDKAKEVLDTLGLKLSDHVLEVRDRSAEPGTIVSQLPEKGQRVARGSSIRVRVASETARSQVDPEQNRKYEYTIRIELSDIDEPVMLRVDMTDSRGTKTIHEERHDPGDEIEVTAEGYGPQADFRIFYDGDMVKQVTKHANEGGEIP